MSSFEFEPIVESYTLEQSVYCIQCVLSRVPLKEDKKKIKEKMKRIFFFFLFLPEGGGGSCLTVCIRYAPRLWEGFGFFGNMCVMIVLLYCTTGYVSFFIVGFLHSLEFHFSICVCDCVCVIVHCLGGCGHLRLQPGKRSQFQCHLQLSRQNGAVPQRRRDPVHPRRHSRFVYLFI